MILGLLALVTASAFTGTAIYINIGEQPARLGLDHRAQLQEWKRSYKRGIAMQGSLALISGALGLVAAYVAGSLLFAVGGVLMIANWPYTLLAMGGVNGRLMALPVIEAGAASRKLIEDWGRLHAVRSALGLLAVLSFLAALLA